MNNIMQIGKGKAFISYDPDIEMFRGEFINLNEGGADFYAADVESLHKEGEVSLREFISMCEEDGVEPFKDFTGKFPVRTSPELHEAASTKAKSEGISLNRLTEIALGDYLGTHN